MGTVNRSHKRYLRSSLCGRYVLLVVVCSSPSAFLLVHSTALRYALHRVKQFLQLVFFPAGLVNHTLEIPHPFPHPELDLISNTKVWIETLTEQILRPLT